MNYSLSAEDKEILKASRERRRIREIARQTLQGEAWDYLEQAAEDAAHNLAIINSMISEDCPEQLTELQEELEATHNRLQRFFDKLSTIEASMQRQEDPRGE